MSTGTSIGSIQFLLINGQAQVFGIKAIDPPWQKNPLNFLNFPFILSGKSFPLESLKSR